MADTIVTISGIRGDAFSTERIQKLVDLGKKLKPIVRGRSARILCSTSEISRLASRLLWRHACTDFDMIREDTRLTTPPGDPHRDHQLKLLTAAASDAAVVIIVSHDISVQTGLVCTWCEHRGTPLDPEEPEMRRWNVLTPTVIVVSLDAKTAHLSTILS